MVSIAAGTPIVVEFQIDKIKENVDMAGSRSIARLVPRGTAGRTAVVAAGRGDGEILPLIALGGVR